MSTNRHPKNVSSRKLDMLTRTFADAVDLRFTGFITLGTSTSPINTISDLRTQDGMLGITLDSFQNFAPLSNVYEQVRVDSVELSMFLTCSTDSTDQPLRPVQILYAYDPDGGAEATRDIFSRNNLTIRTLTFSNPTLRIKGVPGAVTSEGRIEKRIFYDAQAIGDRRFYLGKICAICDGFNNNPSGATLNLAGIIKVTCTFRGGR